ncbi:uncharacterized protein (DUF169 family) [Methanococcus voltae]|uniref:DUF169 domain-containing protein n=1 Tax=Methanococcus voltae TaxID=2188 RepID=UPI001AEB3762|nr:DUF169 domain-containing protein [Methanococcus voltae]MBP2143213.1 uncharacterized protein (DUF169 family) [Methanococcus voltae]
MEILEMGNKLQELLSLKYPAVAVKLVKSKEEIPEGYEEVEQEARHCELVQTSRKEGKKYYAPVEKQMCKGGAYAMGILQNPPKPLETGVLYHKLGNFETEEAAIKTVEAIPKVTEPMFAAVYSPINKVDFEPDAVIVLCTPKQALRLTQAINYVNGGRFEADFSGIQSLCADAVAAVKVRGKANATLACNGSRKFGKIEQEELIFSFPPKDLENIIKALEHFKEIWG